MMVAANSLSRRIGVCIALWALGATVAAQPSSTPPSNLQVLVLIDGRILRGGIFPQAGGYSVERPNGTLMINREQVRCVARDLPDAYRRQREGMTDPTASDLIQLAEWGISYRLYDNARDELKRALKRDPENETARLMLTRLEEQLLATRQPPSPAPLNGEGYVVPQVESLGGLSRSAASQFTGRIQPLLVNKCGGASCHGGESPQDFRLTNVRLESANHRHAAERNLSAVLKQIDIHEPLRSPLLDVSRGAHGGMRTPLFTGAQGAEQQKLLKNWVQIVAKERQAEESTLAKRPALKPNDRASAGGVILASAQVSAAEPQRLPESMPVVPAASDVELPMPLRRFNDAFDPEAFNQKYGPGTPTRPRRLPE